VGLAKSRVKPIGDDLSRGESDKNVVGCRVVYGTAARHPFTRAPCHLAERSRKESSSALIEHGSEKFGANLVNRHSRVHERLRLQLGRRRRLGVQGDRPGVGGFEDGKIIRSAILNSTAPGFHVLVVEGGPSRVETVRGNLSHYQT
jgi:hypothetical protein